MDAFATKTIRKLLRKIKLYVFNPESQFYIKKTNLHGNFLPIF